MPERDLGEADDADGDEAPTAATSENGASENGAKTAAKRRRGTRGGRGRKRKPTDAVAGEGGAATATVEAADETDAEPMSSNDASVHDDHGARRSR